MEKVRQNHQNGVNEQVKQTCVIGVRNRRNGTRETRERQERKEEDTRDNTEYNTLQHT